jgi:hypothetical protein
MLRAATIALLLLGGCAPREERAPDPAEARPAPAAQRAKRPMAPGGGPVAPDGSSALPREALIGPGHQPVFDFDPPAAPPGTVRVELLLDGAAVAACAPGSRLVWDSSPQPDGFYRSALRAVAPDGSATPLGHPARLLVLNRGAKVANNLSMLLKAGAGGGGPVRACVPWTLPEGHASTVAVLRFADTSWKRVRAELGAGSCGEDGHPLASAVSSDGLLVVEHADEAGGRPARDRYLAVTADHSRVIGAPRSLDIVYSIYSH